jgi:altronate hydrolase
VVVVLQEIKAGEAVAAAEGLEIRANEDIMKNHKVAVERIPESAPVTKYGETIGLASRDIQPGDWVHTHNLKSVEG